MRQRGASQPTRLPVVANDCTLSARTNATRPTQSTNSNSPRLDGRSQERVVMSQTTQTLVHALKEWQVAVDALEQGETIVLLRKGGIHETGGKFTIAHDRVWLYPTYEHQQPHLVKAQYTSAIVPVASGEHPETVRIGAWAMITDRVAIRSEDQVRALWPFHIWNEAVVAERLKWKPQQPLDLLLLRVYQLNQPQIIPYSTAYGGCKSWIDLTTAIPL